MICKDLYMTVTFLLHMSQKNYNVEIVCSLLKSSNHIRGLAKELKTNQTTIARKVKELEEINIVDYRREGKNKVYSLKKTIEAKEFVYVSEHHKLINILNKYPVLRNICLKIKDNHKINLAILFGSYAKYKADKDSDIDIYIETRNSKIKEEVKLLNSKISIKIGVYDPRNLLIKEIEKNHIILKGVEKYYEKNKFFE